MFEQLNLPVLPGAACANPDYDPEWWTTAGPNQVDDADEYAPTPEEIAAHNGQAKLICARCPVIQSCLEHALASEEVGIWGGMTPRERGWYRKRYQIVIGTRPILYDAQAKYTA